MAEIRYFRNPFGEDYETKEYDFSKSLVENIDGFKTNVTEMVECYDTETEETYFVPLEDDEQHVVVTVNGKSVDENYKVQSNDLVTVVFMPLSGITNSMTKGESIFTGLMLGLAGGVVLGVLALAAGIISGGWGFFVIAGIGAAAGALWGYDDWKKTHYRSTTVEDKTGEQRPDVRGAENESLAGNPYPFVIGKHLIAPKVIGDPYTEYTGDRGEDAWIRLVYQANYAPVKLTDFKLGDFMLAYNRTQGVDRRTVLNGLLKGYSTEQADDGDIVDKWKNNEIELEIIQHNPNSEKREIEQRFQDNTDINLAARPSVSGVVMRTAGWTEVPSGETYTLYSQYYSNKDTIEDEADLKCVLVTPIISSNVILSKSQLKERADEILAGTPHSETFLAMFEGKGCIEACERYREELEQNQALYYFGKQSINYGHIYPDKVVEHEINSTPMFVCDEDLGEQARIVYKGASFPQNFRTNGVFFTESCPMEFTINLNAQSGLYAARSCTTKEDNKSTTETEYSKIPLWYCIQWRPYSKLNSTSDSEGKDYSSWNLITDWNDNTTDYVDTYDNQAMSDDVTKHKGNKITVKTIGVEDKIPLDTVSSLLQKMRTTVKSESDITIINRGGHNYQPSIDGKLLPDVTTQGHFYYTGKINASDPKDNVLYDTTDKTLYIDAYEKDSAVDGTRYFLTCEKTTEWKSYDYDDSSFTLYNLHNIFGLEVEEDTVDVKRIKILKNYYRTKSESIQSPNGWFGGKQLVNFEPLSEPDNDKKNTGQIRIRGKVTLTKEQCKQLLSPDNAMKSIEVRVLRVSANYLNQTSSNQENYGAYSYSDVITVDSIVTKCFDENMLREHDELVPVKVQSEEDMKKFAYIAIKAKADIAENITAQLRKLTCTAESFSPIWDINEKKWLPENVERVSNYYGYIFFSSAYSVTVDVNNLPDDIDTELYVRKTGDVYEQVTSENPVNGETIYKITDDNYADRGQKRTVSQTEVTAVEVSVFKSMYEKGRGVGKNWYCEEAGSNFGEKMKDIVFKPETETHNGCACNYLDDDPESEDYAAKFNDTTSASGFMLACVGPQNGRWADGYKDLNVLSIGEWWEDCQAIEDGSTYNYDDGEHKAGESVIVKYEANGYITASQKKEALLKDIAATGRAVFTYDETGKLKIVMDKPVDYAEGVINAQNCIEQSSAYSFADVPPGLRIAYNDENDGYEQNSMYCWTDGYNISNYRGTVEACQLKYVTNPYHAHNLGRYILACRVMKKQIITAKIGREGRLFPLGAVVLVQSNEILLGEGSARIQEVITETVNNETVIRGIITDNVFDFKNESVSGHSVKGVQVLQPKQYGKSKVITLRLKNDGETVTIGNVTYTQKSGNVNLFLFEDGEEGIVYDFKTGDIVMLGTMEKISQKFRVVKVKPEEKGSFTMTLNLYDEKLYNYGTVLPTFQIHATRPPVAEQTPVLNETASTVSEYESNKNQIIKDAELSLPLPAYVEIVSDNSAGFIFKDGSPSSITLTCVPYNYTPTSYQWYKKNGSSWSAISGATQSSYTVNYGDNCEGAYKVTVDGEYEDVVTIISVHDGETEPVYTCEISNKTDTSTNRLKGSKNISIYKDGVITSETLYCKWRFERSLGEGGYTWTSWSQTTITNGSGSLIPESTYLFKRGWQVQIYKNSNYTDLLCTTNYNDGVATTIYLEYDTAVVNTTENGYSPAKVTFSANNKLGENVWDYEGWFKIYYATVENPTSQQWTLAYTSSQTEASYQWTVSPSGIRLIKCQLYADNNFSQLVEEDIVNVTKDGESVYNCSVSNENFSIPTDSSLLPFSSDAISVVFTAYKGGTPLTATKSTVTSGKFKISTPSSQGGLTIAQETAGTLTFTPSTSTAILRNKNISVTVTYDDGSTVTKTISISAAAQGPDGQDGADGGYQDYQFAVGDFGLTDKQARALDWYDAPPQVPDGKCLYMATKFIQGA